MMAVLGVVAPVFAVILLGAAARARRMVDAAGMRGLNDLTFAVLLPALLFSAVVEAPEFRSFDVALLYFGVCFLVFVMGVLGARWLLGAGMAQAGVVGLNGCYGNTVMLGVPLVSAAYGAEGLSVMLPVIALHSMLLLPLATILIESEGRGTRNPWRILAGAVPSLVRNPIIASLALAFAWRACGIPVPLPLHRLLGMLGSGGPALALFGLGASLPDFAAQGSLRETGLATTLKLAVQPLLVWAASAWMGLEALPTAVLVLTAGTPTGANAFLLARRTQVAAASSAGTVVVATALSAATLTALLGWLQR